MKTLITNVRIVLPDRVRTNGTIIADDGVIESVGSFEPPREFCGTVIDGGGMYAAPGLVDIHSHAFGGVWGYEDPAYVAKKHLEAGTTTYICSIAGNFETFPKAVQALKSCIETGVPGNMAGIHLEGPYMNKKYGVTRQYSLDVCNGEYREIIRATGGHIRQWTFSPEVRDIDPFVDACLENGIVPAMGHTEASPEQVAHCVKKGARIFTHIFNAAGASINPTRMEGTMETRADEAALLYDDVFCEVIPDHNGVHVRPERIRLLFKTAGISRVVAITDAFVGMDDETVFPEGDIRNGGDCNFCNGLLAGNKMALAQALRNIRRHARLSVEDALRVCSLNPARAVGLDDRFGSLEKGKVANILLMDDDLRVGQVIFKGQAM